MTFMAEYGFQGVDIDWEYPGAPERGGERADTENYVTLIQEMRAAFVSRSPSHNPHQETQVIVTSGATP